MKFDIPFTIAKILLGGGFVIFGLNGFLQFIPIPPPTSDKAKAFLEILVSSKFLAVVKVLEIVGGMMILSGRLAPLGLVILGPIIVSIFLYDLLMDPKGLPIIIFFAALAGYVGYKHKDVFGPFFNVRHDQCTFMPGGDSAPKPDAPEFKP